MKFIFNFVSCAYCTKSFFNFKAFDVYLSQSQDHDRYNWTLFYGFPGLKTPLYLRYIFRLKSCIKLFIGSKFSISDTSHVSYVYFQLPKQREQRL